MKIKSMKLKNFRGYKEEVEVNFDDLTVFVGKNDIGKSTILEALDIFFNNGKGIIKIDKNDLNKEAEINGEKEIIISVCFGNLPEEIVIDSTNRTNFEAEYLLNDKQQLEIIKKYTGTGNPKVYIRANHPNNSTCNELLLKKDNELRKILESNGIECVDKTKNAIMRSAIWEYYKDDLKLELREIDISSKGDGKAIWDKIEAILPLYTLFQADRKNSDEDSEVQDPLKEAVKVILKDENLQKHLKFVADEVERKLKEVSEKTLEKVREMNPEVANTLQPIIPTTSSLKWNDVFKNVSICGDENIPINKRGSGVKRLILLNFFRAEAERRMQEMKTPDIIYAIEEPETSQHTENQKKLIKAFLELSKNENTQIILTTHSANIVRQLYFSCLRLITSDNNKKSISKVAEEQLPYPSLNEVNFSAFNEINEEYHNELYGYIEECGYLSKYKEKKETRDYIRITVDKKKNEKKEKVESKVLSEYIRHQIHHPENKKNIRYTENELRESIELMREFIDKELKIK